MIGLFARIARVVPAKANGPGSSAPGLLRILAFAAIAWVPAEAGASAITYEFGGVITSANPSFGFASGTRFSGTFTYDPKDLAQASEIEGDRNFLLGQVSGFPTPPSPIVEGMTLSIAGQPIASLHGGLGIGLYEPAMGGILANPGATHSATYLNINSSVTDDDAYQLGLRLSNLGSTVYPTLDLPGTFRLTDFTSATFWASFIEPGISNLPTFSGTIDTLSPLATPEPSTAIGFAVGIAAWWIRSRSRRARSTPRNANT